MKIADSLNKLKRLNFRTADLLETKKAFVLYKVNNSVEKVKLTKTDSDRKFQVNDTTILYIIDSFY